MLPNRSRHRRRSPRSPRSHVYRLLAMFLALMVAPGAFGAPSDIVSQSAPEIGGSAPKAQDIPAGDVSTSTQTGAVQYSFPIAVPPGRLGVQPALALSYTNQGAIYGGIAAGWTLTGLPEIKWDGTRGVSDRPLHQSAREFLHYVSDLAGGRPLVEVTASEPSGPGADKTFRARNDSSYARYERIAAGGTAAWRVLLSVQDKVATVGIKYIEGNLGHPITALNALKEAARQAGATTLRIEGTIANPRLEPVLTRILGPATQGAPGGPQDIWVLGL